MTATESVSSPPPWSGHYPPDIAWDAPIPVKSLYALLDDTVARFPDRPAFDFLGRKWTYAELGDLVDRFACGLKPMVRPGSRVGLLLPNCTYYPIAYYAIAKCGATVVNFNPLYAERELAYQIKDSGTEIMVTIDVAEVADKMAPLIDECGLKAVIVCPLASLLPFPKNLLYPFVRRREIAHLPNDPRVIRYAKIVDNDGKLTPHPVDPQRDIAVLQYTGGTTGTPKGAMLTHANVYANAVQSAMWFHDCAPGEDRMLAVIPFFHVFAMTCALNLSVLNGLEIIALPRFALKETLETIHKKRPTLFPAVPTIYTAINHHRELAKYDLTSIRYCISGGAPLPVEVKQTFERLTGCVLVEGYGLSETSPVATANPLFGKNKPGTIGLPLPGTTIEIISTEDHVTPMPMGQPGELCVRGPQVMAGYWNKPEETAEAMIGGRFHTGDVATMDADGYLTIVDRIKDIVIASGYKIYPRKVEEQIYLHPAVEECVAGGVPDIYRGETLKVWIKLKPEATLTADELRAFLAERLSPIEMPKVIEFRDAPLPKTLIGKLSRKALIAEDAAKSGPGGSQAPA